MDSDKLMKQIMRYFVFLMVNMIFVPQAQDAGIVSIWDYSDLDWMWIMKKQVRRIPRSFDDSGAAHTGRSHNDDVGPL